MTARVAIAAGYFPAFAKLPRKAQRKAEEFIEGDSRASVCGATITYLACVGAMSEPNAGAVFPILEQALREIPKQSKKGAGKLPARA